MPVVVRDAKGNAVGNLRKEDFQLFDKGNAQIITSFTVEETSSKIAEDRSVAVSESAATEVTSATGNENAMPIAIPDRFVALLIDDLHLEIGGPGDPPPGMMRMGELVAIRKAALKYIDALRPADRIAIFTTSGLQVQDFTSDRKKLREAVAKVGPQHPLLPTIGGSDLNSVVTQHDSQRIIIQSGDIITRMANLPGQHTVVLLSPGMALHEEGASPWSQIPETMALIDHAIRSHVVINSLDTRGLYPVSNGVFSEFLARVADGTGGRFIRDTNDMDNNLRQLAEAPKYIYVLGFSPEAPKPDGSFHALSVKLQNGKGLELEARKGYWAPDATELARRQTQPAPAGVADTPQVSETETKEVAEAIGVGPFSSNDAVSFKAETNLVLVPVVVRDGSGNAVGNLRKEDFQLFDRGKPQVIKNFKVEKSSGQMAGDRSVPNGDKSGALAAPMAIPDRFVALVFDDYHLKICALCPDAGWLVWSRDAARRYIATLRPSDRVAVLTTTGETALDFTSDRAKLEETLLKVHLSTEKDAVELESRRSLGQLQDIVKRISVEPGQRTIVLLSPGFQMRVEPAWSLLPDTMALINRAIQTGIVINALNVRGLEPGGNGPDEVLFRLADGTGGTYVRDENDYDSALYQLAAAPEYRYILGFSPDDLKQDGSLHNLKISLMHGHGLEVQARRAYWDANPAGATVETAKGKSAPEIPQASEKETKEVAEAIGAAAEATVVIAPAPAPSNAEEISTHDVPVTFKAQTNLVEVPVVVRDSEGHAVGDLRKEDFRLFDKGKRQDIAKFSVEKAAGPATAETPAHRASPSGTARAGVTTQVAPGRFIAFVFDDVHIEFKDLPQVRDAVRRYLGASVQPGDRVALFTTSGKIAIDFTDKTATLDEALLRIRPSPYTSSALRSCFYVSYFQAVQIEQQVSLHPSADDVSRSVALKTAVYDAARCVPGADAFDVAVQEVRDSFLNGKQETRANLMTLSNLVRRMALMPGQRRIVLASPGFFVSPDLQDQGSDLIALAIRSKVLISTIDARGVWTSGVFEASEPSNTGPPPPDVITFKESEGTVADDELVALAEGTGGTANFNNDFDGGVRKAAAAPEYLYVLGFAPQNLKPDGSFHPLKVTLNSGEKVSLQVRRGYWAPRHAEDAGAVTKQELEDAVFSRDEIHNLPVEMHTQVTKADSGEKLNVLTSVDLKLIHLRKEDDRNRNDLTIVAAVFDPNGNFIAGTEKILQLRLRDATVQALEQKPPVTIPTDFDMKAGAYLVRLVVRDAEGQQLTAENAAVQIP